MDREYVIRVYVRAHTQYSTIKKNEIMPFATAWMNLEGAALSEVTSDRERQILDDLTYMWVASNDTEQIGVCQRWGVRGGQNR